MKVAEQLGQRTPALPGRRPTPRARSRPPRRGPRWLNRRWHRYRATLILVPFALLVAVPLVFDLAWPAVHAWIDGQAHEHEVGVNLAEHIAVAALVAAATYYWVLGRKRQRALKKYRSQAENEPQGLVEWWQGGAPSARRTVTALLADTIERSPEPAMAVVKARAGSGRTGFIVDLVRELGQRKLIPIPVLARRDGKLDLEKLARKTFCQEIDPLLSSDREADEIWHSARSTRDVVILVDGLDDEVVDALSRDEDRFQATIRWLQRRHIALVLTTTKDLPLGEIRAVREDLDLFSHDEAAAYVREELSRYIDADDAVAALLPLHDPVDGFLIATVYLDLIAQLHKTGYLPEDLPAHRDRWRYQVICAYLRAVNAGLLARPADGDREAKLAGEDLGKTLSAGAEKGAGRSVRGAENAVNTVAKKLLAEPSADLTVPLDETDLLGRELREAVDAKLLWLGAGRVGFAADDLAAYFVARVLGDDPSPLLAEVRRVAEADRSNERGERHILVALIFWSLQHPEGRPAAFNKLMTAIEDGEWTRPAVIAAAVRIRTACELGGFDDRIAQAAEACFESLDTPPERQERQDHAAELLRLVRALAEWSHPAAHELLWRMATNQNIEVEWPAAKALARTVEGDDQAFAALVDKTLTRAEKASIEELTTPESRLGNEIGSLAWILPALRTQELFEPHFARVVSLCMAEDMSPLRGEMSLAQGLKFAIINRRAEDKNVAHARRLLLEPASRPRFWHARLVLVQALLAQTWQSPENSQDLERELARLRARESHRLVLGGIDLARRGVRDLRRARNGQPLLTRYIWIHERDAVRWVEQEKATVSQLAADTVLLSNMIYRLRKADPSKANANAVDSQLPICIRNASDRHNVIDGCECTHGLCANGEEPAVMATRARFSESFCREQARLAARFGPPAWTRGAKYRRKQLLEEFWQDQAADVARDPAGPE